MIFTANPSMMDPESLQRDTDLWSVPDLLSSFQCEEIDNQTKLPKYVWAFSASKVQQPPEAHVERMSEQPDKHFTFWRWEPAAWSTL